MRIVSSSTEHGSAASVLSGLLDPDVQSLAIAPQLIGKQSAWWTHVPFAFWLTSVMRPDMFVELGTHNGVSFSAVCEAVLQRRMNTRCYAVDIWTGDEHSGAYGEDVYADLKAFSEKRYGAFSYLMRMRFEEACSFFDDRLIDLLHIDGFHTYDAVKADFETWKGKLSDRGVIIFHDTNARLKDFGVWRFFGELAKNHPTFEFVHGHGLGIVAYGSNVCPEISRLCSGLTESEIGTIRNLFSAIGTHWDDMSNLQMKLDRSQRPERPRRRFSDLLRRGRS